VPARCRDNARVQRHRVASRLTSWLFVAALLLKSAVPLLASAAASLQGRATAEICDVYGVDMSLLAARPHATPAQPSHQAHESHHAHDAAHGHHEHRADGPGSSVPAERTPAHGPASRVAHGGDHCALSALAFALTSDAPSVAARAATLAPLPARGAPSAPLIDPAARWAAQLQHAPPASS